MKTNYHGHTKWCKHATSSSEEIIKEAIKNNYEELAISEHVPQLHRGKYDKMRLQNDDIHEFFHDLDLQIEKYSKEIKIYKALECEYFSDSLDWYLFLKKKYKIDYLILGHHFNEKQENSYFDCVDDEQVKRYQDEVLEALQTKMFAFFAHPDVYLNNYPLNKIGIETAHAIFQKCEDLNIPVEINANGLRNNKGYPNRDFWKISTKYKLTYLINADSHKLSDLSDQALDDTYQFAHDLGIVVTEKIIF